MNTELGQIIKYDSEGFNLDYKKEEYPLGRCEKKNELLKDISAFANHHSDSDKYIIIGVKEENGIASEFFGIENLTDEAAYQQFLTDNIEPEIDFEYKSMIYNGKQIAYFRIYNNKNRPYLFKKNVQNPITSKIEYKIGDGFIKVGSSSRKLQRSDFENIYTTRLSEKDRKSDLQITTYFGISYIEELGGLEVPYIDIEISNQSNKSIGIDLEMKVFKNKLFRLSSTDQLVEELNDRESRNDFGNYINMFRPKIKNFHVEHQDMGDYTLVSRIGYAKQTSINLSQNTSDNDMFLKDLLIVGDAYEIEAELIIKSDDFTEGALIEKLIFKKII